MKPLMWTYLETAGAAEIASVLREWRSETPRPGVLALVSEHAADRVPLLQQCANQHALPLAGAIVPGLIAGAEFKKSGVLLAAHDASVPQAIIPLRRGAETPGGVAELAAFVETHACESGDDTLLLFIDAMTPDIASLLDNLYLHVGDRVRYAGTNVGSESFRPVPCLFDNTSFVEGAALALMLPRHPGACLAHRYCKTTPLCVATGAGGNRIAFIDGRPAFEAYRELIAQAHGVELTRENFYRHAVHFPLALHLAEGEPLVRIPVSVDEQGCLHCVGEVPEASLLSVVEAADPGSNETAREIAGRMQRHAMAAALAFYCAGRLLHHGEDAAGGELRELQNALAPVPLFGALSLGEIANHQGQGYPRFHNATIVALPWR